MSKDRMEEVGAGVSVAEQASAWWITLNAGEATPADQEAFREWAARSPERIEAFLKTARLTRVLKSRQLRWPDTSQEELARQAREEGAEVVSLNNLSYGAPRIPARSPMLLFAVAATLVGIIASLWMLLRPAHLYDTAVGELRSVALDDGSIVTLNTASRIEVKFDERRRRIELLAGEGLFQVARDPKRPFEVVAGETVVRAVGTQFNVDLRPRRTVVTVVEGKVAVLADEEESPPEKVLPRRASRQAEVTYLSAGEQLTLESRRALPLKTEKPADIAVVTAWTQRRLVFDHRPIGEVAEEFNRYNELQIEIAGAELRDEQMTGVFKANDPESFLDFVSKMPGVRVERDADNTRVRASL